MAIIVSLLDTDFYKLRMLYLAWKLHPKAISRYAFKNRTKKVRLAEIIKIDDLKRELDHIRTLGFTARELVWVKKYFNDDAFIGFLAGLRLPAYELSVKNGQYGIEVEGTWPEAILWETLILCAVNELYYRTVLEQSGRGLRDVEEESDRRLTVKIDRLNAMTNPPAINEFGTRRRFSRANQEHVVRRLAKELRGFKGTSNCRLAMDENLDPSGTQAHETYMIYSGIYRHLDTDKMRSHNKLLRDWYDLFGDAASIALTDTFGSKFFFEDMTAEQAKAWRGLRQDSGDPFEFGEDAIKFYEGHGIDPRTKVIVFSDGLDVDTIIALTERFEGRVGLSFGWGTNLTNDVGFETLSLVVKAIMACGYWLVKLSDTIQKAMGPKEEVERIMRLTGYTGGLDRPCVN